MLERHAVIEQFHPGLARGETIVAPLEVSYWMMSALDAPRDHVPTISAAAKDHGRTRALEIAVRV